MTREQIFYLIRQQLLEILPNLENKQVTIADSLKALGADSIDRADIIIQSMAALELKIPLIELAQAQNIDDIVEIFYQKLKLQVVK